MFRLSSAVFACHVCVVHGLTDITIDSSHGLYRTCYFAMVVRYTVRIAQFDIRTAYT